MSIFGTLLALMLSGSVTLKDCGAGTSVFTINSLSISPDVSTPGTNSTLSLDYTVPFGVLVSSGTAKYDITLNGIPFPGQSEPLCQDVPCPLGPGRYSNTSTVAWPAGVSGKVKTKMTWLDDTSSVLLCLEVATSL
jgi:hypothetical protein